MKAGHISEGKENFGRTYKYEKKKVMFSFAHTADST